MDVNIIFVFKDFILCFPISIAKLTRDTLRENMTDVLNGKFFSFKKTQKLENLGTLFIISALPELEIFPFITVLKVCGKNGMRLTVYIIV